jgi:hypothetical protein
MTDVIDAFKQRYLDEAATPEQQDTAEADRPGADWWYDHDQWTHQDVEQLFDASGDHIAEMMWQRGLEAAHEWVGSELVEMTRARYMGRRQITLTLNHAPHKSLSVEVPANSPQFVVSWTRNGEKEDVVGLLEDEGGLWLGHWPDGVEWVRLVQVTKEDSW